MKVYTAKSMSGRDAFEAYRTSINEKMLLECFGMTVLDPLLEEKVQPVHKPIQASKADMDKFWPRDKEMIREANIVFDMTPTIYSEGRSHELGYARYFLWKPIVRVFPPGEIPWEGSVAHYEDDVVVDSIIDACAIAHDQWGTRKKRILWRLKLLWRCLPKFLRFQIGEWK
jgi:hypothetical protein